MEDVFRELYPLRYRLPEDLGPRKRVKKATIFVWMMFKSKISMAPCSRPEFKAHQLRVGMANFVRLETEMKGNHAAKLYQQTEIHAKESGILHYNLYL